MNTPPEHRLSPEFAERLLDGDLTDGPAVARILAAAAAAPGVADPMAGEAEALRAFRQVQLAAPAPRGRFTAMKAAIAAALTTKLAAGAAVAAAATGSIVLAASGAGTAVHGHAHPAPNLNGLCHAVQAGATANGGQAAHNPAFSALATAAGGAANIDAFCARRIGAAPSHPGKADHPGKGNHPGKADHPGKGNHPGRGNHPGAPSGLPTPSHPSGAPSGLPTPSHPTGKPSGLPTPSHSAGRP